ncbi:shikimate dehydrogenase [Aestuariimicrobium ganziense]|uniref:shikimate dehydrogenase n=1 Tax=Aestuariimicrobium ganziense TaxID=2773677 RepID=UPI001943A13D|nr:shikimate dehydrogenase [Aestuariimicrobium ganziense]
MRCAVIGDPVHHSLSPALHLAAYRALGLDWHYQACHVTLAILPDFVTSLDESWRGLSCTMPHKEAIVAMGATDEVVDLVGVANTLVFDGRPADPGTTLVRNTDVPGFGIALAAHGITSLGSATIVGNGATARSALVAAAGLGATRVDVLARDPQRAVGLVALGEQLGVDVTATGLGDEARSSDLVVSTVPVSGSGPHAEALVALAPVVFDSVYDPWPTPLAEAGSTTGRLVLNGLDLLAGQAVDQVRWMTGGTVTFELLRTAARDAIAARATT